MNLIVNGETRSVSDNPHTISDILTLFNVEMPDMVSVQLNGAFIERKNFPSTTVKDADEIDFLYFIGGGK